MIGLAQIACHVPDQRIDNIELARGLGTSDTLLRDKIGFLRTARKDKGVETSDLCVEAVKRLLAVTGLDSQRIECLVVVTQNPDGRGLPHTSAIVHGKLGLSGRCAAFDISLGCSGFVYGLATVSALMAANGMTRGVLATADPYSKIIDSEDRDTVILFGDAAAAALLSDQPLWRIGRTDFGTLGQQRDGLAVSAGGKLVMNGRAVFNFSATEIPPSIRRTLAANSLELHDIDRFILHQGSRFIVDTIARRLEIEDRTPFCAQDYGNLVSSSIPVALADAVNESDRQVLISGFGVGLSFATTVLSRV
jgi:3-oxoacyl-[acyl-carrier-protein] synthase-3